MRIISGSAKGRRLFTPSHKQKAIRPTSDRAREALFSIIGPEVIDAAVLDLFAGTGAFGCEALSRGAKSVAFIEYNRNALALIAKNVALIPGGIERAKIIRYDLRNKRNLQYLALNSASAFDLVFADPPYQKGLSEKILHHLDDSSVLSKTVLVIIEEKKNIDLIDELVNLSKVETRMYGDSLFSFYRMKITMPR